MAFAQSLFVSGFGAYLPVENCNFIVFCDSCIRKLDYLLIRMIASTETTFLSYRRGRGGLCYSLAALIACSHF